LPRRVIGYVDLELTAVAAQVVDVDHSGHPVASGDGVDRDLLLSVQLGL
jgi:hypothetical protein